MVCNDNALCANKNAMTTVALMETDANAYALGKETVNW